MRQYTPKEQDIIELAKKGGNDASLFLLQEMHKMADTIQQLTEQLKKEPPEDVRIEKVALRLAAKISAKGEDGEDGHTPTNEELLALIKPLIPQIKDGATPTKQELLALIRPLIPVVENGTSPTDEELLGLIIPLIPQLPDMKPFIGEISATIEQNLPQYGTAFRDGLELLPEGERLHAKYIDGLKELILRLAPARVGSIGGSVVHKFTDDETPVGTVNGSNTTFTLSKTPIGGSLKLYVGGSRQRVTQDYTLSDRTITFIIPPVVGEILLADYRHY